jgi:hypothetical protein
MPASVQLKMFKKSSAEESRNTNNNSNGRSQISTGAKRNLSRIKGL